MDLTVQYLVACLFAYFVHLFNNVGNAHRGADLGRLRSCTCLLLWRRLLPSLHWLNILIKFLNYIFK